MTHLLENKWNPVTLGNRGNGYSISNYAVSTTWYNKVIDNTGNRRARLKNYDEADQMSVEIARALDMIAEDVSSSNADDEELFNIEFPDDYKINKTTLKLIKLAKDLWQKRTKMEAKLFHRTRKALKYGAVFFREQPDGTLKELPTERMVGYIISEDDEDLITHYIYDPSIPRLDKHGRNYQHRRNPAFTQSSNSVEEVIPVDELVIMKIGEGPFGQSLVETVYSVWKQMALLESAVVIYRVVRAPERRVYYIDVGNLQGPKREASIERQRIRLMQKNANKSGSVDAEYDPHSTSEDIFIPTNSTGKGSRVETLPGGAGLGEMGDVEWFAKKMAAGLRIPNSMIDTYGDQQNQFNDMRVGQVYQIEVRYMGFCARIKRDIEPDLESNFRKFCTTREIVIPVEMNLVINESNSFGLYKEMELNQQMLNIFSSTLSMPQLSKRYALQKYLNMDQDQLADNEIEKLYEMGLLDADIKKMSETEIRNIVYGDASLGEKYGVAAKDASTGF